MTNELGIIENFDKGIIPTCEIIGIPIAAINMEWLLNFFKATVNNKQGNFLAGEYICVSNVHTTIMAHDSPNFRVIHQNSLMALPDGGPLSTIGRRKGYKYMKRVTGPSLMEELFKQSAENKYRHYFFGATEETLGKMAENLLDNYPEIQIAGMYSPPFRPLTAVENEEIIKKINETKPHFIWVGLGAPKQEIWMAANERKLTGVMIGVGAGFDYIAKNIKRAPLWMQKWNLEWLFRLFQEPKRLFKRYFITNSKFIYYVIIRKKLTKKLQ